MTHCPYYEKELGKAYQFNRFLTPRNHTVQQLARNIVHNLENTGRDTLVERVIAAFNFVSINVKYVFDEHHFGFTDYWQFPSKTLSTLKGDCEDTSFLLASLILALRIDPRTVHVVLGTFRGDGHAGVEIIVDNRWRVLESTSNHPFVGWFERGYDYLADLEIYPYTCAKVDHRNIYNRFSLKYV